MYLIFWPIRLWGVLNFIAFGVKTSHRVLSFEQWSHRRYIGLHRTCRSETVGAGESVERTRTLSVKPAIGYVVTRSAVSFMSSPESECRRKWKTLRDQHRRERQREKERRESGIGLFNYRPWRYSSILSFLNPFIDARAAGTNGWALDPQPSQLHAAEMVGCSTTTETRSDDDENYGSWLQTCSVRLKNASVKNKWRICRVPAVCFQKCCQSRFFKIYD